MLGLDSWWANEPWVNIFPTKSPSKWATRCWLSTKQHAYNICWVFKVTSQHMLCVVSLYEKLWDIYPLLTLHFTGSNPFRPCCQDSLFSPTCWTVILGSTAKVVWPARGVMAWVPEAPMTSQRWVPWLRAFWIHKGWLPGRCHRCDNLWRCIYNYLTLSQDSHIHVSIYMIRYMSMYS